MRALTWAHINDEQHACKFISRVIPDSKLKDLGRSYSVYARVSGPPKSRSSKSQTMKKRNVSAMYASKIVTRNSFPG